MNVAIKPENVNTAGVLAGKLSLVTGSTSGIGLGIARALAAAGSGIVLIRQETTTMIPSWVRQLGFQNPLVAELAGPLETRALLPGSSLLRALSHGKTRVFRCQFVESRAT
jgi:NAD(P)-dependent dehydrogenase (short-subunit alcohol dehydrogenase family)